MKAGHNGSQMKSWRELNNWAGGLVDSTVFAIEMLIKIVYSMEVGEADDFDGLL